MLKRNNYVNRDFNVKHIKDILVREHKFITDLFSVLPIPASAVRGDLTNEEAEKSSNHNDHEQSNRQVSRARSLTELRERLKGIQNKRLIYKDKLLKRKLKQKIKKKSRREEILAQKKLARIGKKAKPIIKVNLDEESKADRKQTEPVFNKEGKMVFSKFNFSDIGPNTKKKILKNPKKILNNIETEKATLAELESKGERNKVKEIKYKKAWKNAIAKAEGQKVKDDPILLKKTIKRKEQMHRSSKKKWQTRQEGVKKAQELRLAKRNENIAKRTKEKKMKKIKKAVKKGKVIPGF